MKVSKKIDWFAATQTADSISEFNQILPDGFDLSEKIAPTKWYPHRWRMSPCGVYAHSASGTISQMIEFPGQDMQKLRDFGMSDIALLNHANRECTHVTRLDYAVDIRETEVNALDFLELWRHGYFKVKTRKVKHFTTEGEQPETTIYFGSEKSDRMLRIYDKGAQMGMLHEAWLRVELQNRKERADTLARDMIKRGLTAAGDQILKNTYACDACPALKDALDDFEVDLTPIPRKQTNWQKWMDGQVFDSIVKHSRDETEREFITDWFNRILMAISEGQIR